MTEIGYNMVKFLQTVSKIFSNTKRKLVSYCTIISNILTMFLFTSVPQYFKYLFYDNRIIVDSYQFKRNTFSCHAF